MGGFVELLTQGNFKAAKGECHFDLRANSWRERESDIARLFLRLRFPGAAQHAAKRSGALQTRDRFKLRSLRRSRTSGASLRLPRIREMISEFAARLSVFSARRAWLYLLSGIRYYHGDEPRRLGLLAGLAERLNAPLVAVNDVHYHAPERRPPGGQSSPSSARNAPSPKRASASPSTPSAISKPPEDMAHLFKKFPDLPSNARSRSPNACTFSLGDAARNTNIPTSRCRRARPPSSTSRI